MYITTFCSGIYGTTETTLYTDLGLTIFTGSYNADVRPRIDPTQVVDVTLDFELHSIRDMVGSINIIFIRLSGYVQGCLIVPDDFYIFYFGLGQIIVRDKIVTPPRTKWDQK